MNKKMFLVLITIALIAGIGTALALNPASWQGSVSVPTGNPTPTPAPTDTFTVTASMNGTAQTSPNAIVIPTSAWIGDVYVITYTLTSTANQPITITQSSTPTGLIWDKTSLPLAVSASGTMSLTVPVTGTSKTINVNFVASP